MKSVLPWVVALAMLGAAVFQYMINRNLLQQVNALQAEQAQTATLRAEVEQLKRDGSPAQAQELEKLRKGADEILKARNELQQLRNEKKELTQKAQTAVAQAIDAKLREDAARGQIAAISTNIQALTAQALADQQKAFADRYGVQINQASRILNTCINNLRQMNGAMDQWALENRKAATAVPQAADLSVYLKNGIPACPGGGVYTLGAVNAGAACSVAGHSLPVQ